jgi:hypothetical protein
MNFSKSFQALNVAVLAALVVGSVSAADVRQEFSKTDQPFVFFKALTGAKYPTLTKVDPAKNQLDVVLCGAQTKNGDVKLIKKAKEIKNMVAIRLTMNFAESCTKLDKRYEGIREAYGAIALFRLMKTVGILDSEVYKGTVLVDEYVQGLPMKIVLSNKEQFDALKTYLVTNFAEQSVVPAEQKPLLLLNILDKKAQLTDDDNAFLNEYFQVLDPCAAETKEFFENANKALFDMIDKTRDAKKVGESFGESVIGKLEEAAKDFDSKKIGSMMTAAIVGGASAYIISELKSPVIGKDGVVSSWGQAQVEKVRGLFLNQDGSLNTTALMVTVALIVSVPVLMHILFDVPEDVEEAAVNTDASRSAEEIAVAATDSEEKAVVA